MTTLLRLRLYVVLGVSGSLISDSLILLAGSSDSTAHIVNFK